MKCPHDTDGDGNCPIHPNGCPDIDPKKYERAKLQDLALMIQNELPHGWGFFCQVFPFSDKIGEQAHFVSNANREDVVKTMQDFINRNIMPKPENN